MTSLQAHSFSRRDTLRAIVFLLLALGVGVFSPARSAEDLLPDIVVKQDDLADHDVVTDGDRVLLRLTITTPNIGEGPLHVLGDGPPLPNGNRLVNQRIFQSDGNWYDRPAGEFENHPTHNHVHLEGWAVFRLRGDLTGGGVGDIVRQGEKTSFCLLDVAAYDQDLPGFPANKVYVRCEDDSQGISVGWQDTYRKNLYGQNIDVKDLDQGTYWLEVEVDPDDHLLESNEGNNIERIEVQVGEPVFIDGPLEVGPRVEQIIKVDLRIGRKSGPNSHRGNDVYDSSGRGARQFLKFTERKARRIRFFGSIENEGSSHQHFPFRTSGRRLRKLIFWHFDTTGSGRLNISGQTLGSGYLYHLDPGETGTWLSEVRLNRISRRMRASGRRIRAAQIFKVSLSSAKDSTRAMIRFD